jgi:hypothetical protein
VTNRIFEPLDDKDQELKAEHEAEEADDSPIGIVEEAIDEIISPLTKERPTAEEAEEIREETDQEERSS